MDAFESAALNPSLPFGSGSSQPAPSLEAMRQRLAALKQTRASLQTELQILTSLPEAPLSTEDRVPHPLARELMDAEERLVLTRMAGWTLFLADMAPGRRAKSIEGAHVGLGVRMEGFCRGRFHDPHYLLFARGDAPADAVVTFSALEAKALDDAASAAPSMGPGGGPLRLVRHTLPPWLPLAQLVKDLLPASNSEEDSTEGQGWDLIPQLQKLGGGIETFLSAVHTHLQAHLSRRCAFEALSPSAKQANSSFITSTVEGFASSTFTSLLFEATINADVSEDQPKRPHRPPTRLRAELRLAPLCDRLGRRTKTAPAECEKLEPASHGAGGSVAVQVIRPGAGFRDRDEVKRRGDLERCFFAAIGAADEELGPEIDQAWKEARRVVEDEERAQA